MQEKFGAQENFGGAVTGAGPRRSRALHAVATRQPAGPVLIETKIHAPTPREAWVERPGLLELLAETRARLVLVAAPAGFGKTALVAQWRASAAGQRPFAWISLDEADNDPARLWWYVMQSLERACQDFGAEQILGHLRAPDPDITGKVLPTLVNELGAVNARVVLVLDDYDVISEPDCHEQVTFLLRHLPESAQVVLVTRADPPLPLAGMRASAVMAEFRARELRFAPADAAALVRAVSGAELGDRDLAILLERTEGWPAGLYLAALSLRGHPSPGDFVREFGGGNRLIADYIGDEVLSRQPPEIRTFLLHSSVLRRFSAPLCAAVLGLTSAAGILDVLERENLFLVPLDENRQWFRYHVLFAEALLGRLTRTEPDMAARLHARAAAWHRQSGSVDEAIRHAIASGDSPGAVDLIARHWWIYVDSGQVATFAGWMRLLDDEVMAADPVAAHCAMWAGALSGDRESARRWLPHVTGARRDGPLPDGMRSFTSSVAMLRGVHGFEGLRSMRDSASAAVRAESDPASRWYSLARSALGFSYYMSGEPAAAAAPLQDAVSSETGTSMAHMLALSVLSLVALDAGDVTRARDLASAARRVAGRRGLGKCPQAALADTAAGAVHAALGRLPEARADLEHAVRVRRVVPGLNTWVGIEAMARLAQVLLDLGERSRARALVEEVRLLLTAMPDGAEAQLARLERLDRLGGRPRAPELADPLTEREVTVLHLLQGSLSLREIARELHLSVNTVKTHAQAIYRKLGVSTRHDAVCHGRRLGVL